MNKFKNWYALHNMGLYETRSIKGYGPFTLNNIRIAHMKELANDIINVQPISNSIGQIFTLNSTFGKKIDAKD